MKETFKVQGFFRLGRRDRETGEVEWTCPKLNTITDAGLQDVLDLAIGESTSTYGDGDATITLYDDEDGTGDVLFTSSTQGVGDPAYDPVFPRLSGPSGTYAERITWRWEDISVDEYTPLSVTFKRDGAAFNFSVANVQEGEVPWGSKTDRYNWLFDYVLTFSGSLSVFGDGASWYGGLPRIAALMLASEDPPFDSLTKLTALSSDEETANSWSVTSGPTRTGSTVEFVWEIDPPESGTRPWYYRAIAIGNYDPDVGEDDLLWKIGDDTIGVQSTNEEFEYTWTLTAAVP